MTWKSPCNTAVPSDARASFELVSGDGIELRVDVAKARCDDRAGTECSGEAESTGQSHASGSTEVLVAPPGQRALLPAVGEAVGEFQLLAMLGRGIKGS